MKFGKILVSIYQPGSAAILNSIPGLEVKEGLDSTHSLLNTLIKMLLFVFHVFAIKIYC